MGTVSSNRISLLDFSMASVIDNCGVQELSGKHLFITGGTGFFGLWLLTALRALHFKGLDVRATVLSRDPRFFLSNNPQFCGQSWLEFVAGDVKSFSLSERRFDLLLHAATETSQAAHAEPAKMLDNIYLGTRRVLELARTSGVRKVLMVSSGAVYGRQPQHLAHQPDDSQMACDPLSSDSAYGEGKRLMELLGAIFQHETGIDCTVARCFSFSGPGLPLDGHFAIGNFIRDALYNDTITVEGDGSSVRSYLHGADLAVWLLCLLLRGRGGQSYNVGSDEPLSIGSLAYAVRDILAPNKSVRILGKASTEPLVRHTYVPAITNARELGCRPWTPLEISLTLTARYWKGQAYRNFERGHPGN